MQGIYRFLVASQFVIVPSWRVNNVTVSADGSICFNAPRCSLQGQLRIDDPASGFFDFEIRDSLLAPYEQVYRGRGWLERSAGAVELVMVGDNGKTGFGLIALRQP